MENESASLSDAARYWLELSDYDLETAAAMLASGRYLYVAFMAHQSVEKMLKAFHVQHQKAPAPFSHSLSYLAKKAGLSGSFSEEQKQFIDMLEPMNIECRYPTHKEQLMKSLSAERCRHILDNTRELQQWIRQRL
jgi:HEPN domain-containing protein